MANAEAALMPGRTIGFVGLGNMGRPMARRIAAAGYVLQAVDARPGIAAELARECGAKALSSTAELGADLDALILILPDGHAVRRVLLDDGLAQRLKPATVVIDMGSSDPIGTLELAARLAELSVHMVDAPVSGGVPRALTGELTIMAGGEPALLERCRPLLATMGNRIVATGKLGSGQAMKSLNNFVSAIGMVAAVEAVHVAQRFGLDPMVAAEVLNGSTGKNNTTEHKLRQFILSRSFASGFSLDLMAKDLGIAASLSRHTGSQAILLDWCLSFWQAAQRELGPGLDHTEIARWIETVIEGDPPSH